jgi:predicted ATPase
MDRAGAVQPAFDVTVDNAAAVAQICHRLGRIPLAIELAAARMRVLTADQIADRLADRFRLLTSGSRSGLPRHQTLRALVDWSHNLLSEGVKVLFRRASVFAGGWTLEAAEWVCAVEPISRADVVELLSGLVDKSLVLADEQADGHMRYRLPETLREYAAERLEEVAEEAALRQRHAMFMVTQIERIDHLRETSWPSWHSVGLPWLLAEQDNVRAVLGDCRAGRVHVDGQQVGVRLCASMWWFWLIYDRLNEAWNWHLSLLNATPVRVSSQRFRTTWFAGITAGALANLVSRPAC